MAGNLANLKLGMWQPGQSGNPAGRAQGAKHKLQDSFLRELAADFEAHGVKALVECRTTKPADYIRIIASLMPKELEVKRLTEEMSDDELVDALAALRSLVLAQNSRERDAEALEAEAVVRLPAV